MELEDRAEPKTPDGCCDDLADGQFCQSDCVRWIQNDETATPSEMGFYYKFESDPTTGRPSGCRGLDKKWKGSVWPDCLKEDYEPEGETLSSIVEEFADNQQTWMNEFVLSFEKMVTNGYAAEDLEDGPTEWFQG